MTTYIKSINNGLDEIMQEDERVYLLGEDICDPYGGAFKVTKGLSSKYPSRVINTPISEAGITGVAAGMAMRGLRPVVEIMFGDFLTLAADQIFSNISKLGWVYNNAVDIPVVIRTPMGGRRGYGPTHSQSIEKIFLGIPGIKIVAPSSFHNPGHLLKRSIQDDKPVLFIEYKLDYPKSLKCPAEGKIGPYFIKNTGNPYPVIHMSPTDFEDDDVIIITYGGMASFAEAAADRLLYEDDISAEIIIPSLIKPISVETFLPSIKRMGKVVTVEEGTLANGWGAEVSALLSDEAFKYLQAPVKRVAAKNYPIANTKVLEDHILPNADDIVKSVKEIV